MLDKSLRILSPVASPISFKDILEGLKNFYSEEIFKKLKNKIAEYFNVKYAFFFSSGRAALTIILKVLKEIKGKDEVIIPGYTCFSVPSSVVKAGLKVVLCDIDLNYLDFDLDQLRKLINKNTLAIIPVHLCGYPCRMDKIIEVSENYDLFLVEDCAQALGGDFKGKKLGTIGDIGFFSLGRGKNLTSVDGGFIVTNNDFLAEKLEKFREIERINFLDKVEIFLKSIIISIFLNPYFYFIPVILPFVKLGISEFSTKFKLKDFSSYQAGLFFSMWDKLAKLTKIRRKNAFLIMKKLKNLNKLRFPIWDKDSYPVFLRLPVIIEDKNLREKIFKKLNDKGLGVSKFYPTSLKEIKELKPYLKENSNLENSTYFAEHVITLPTHPLLKKRDIEEIRNIFFDCLKENSCWIKKN